jgi:H+-transporting ATPase
MTGDGVNDAPALKQAEMGIAMSNADDVAKTSASIVMTGQGQGLAVIIDAIKISRRIYQRVLTWVLNKITKTIQSIGILMVGYFWLQSIVISLLGIVLLVFANDFLTMSLATDHTKHTTNPNKWNVKNVTSVSVILGVLLIIEGVIAIFIGINYFHLGLEQLQTFILLWLLFTSIFKIFIVRERKWFWNSRPGRELIITTVVAIVGFTFLGIYGIIIPALTLNQVLFILGYSALFIFLLDPLKYYIFKKFGL